MVPVEQWTERVIREGAIRVVERTLQRFDQDGRPTPPEVTVIEQETRPEGHTIIRRTTSRRDINGNSQIAERSLTEVHKSGMLESTDSSVERPTINGSIETVEKRSISKTGSADNFQQTATTFRRGSDGFYEAVRVVTESKKNLSTTTEQNAEYEIGPNGVLELHNQTARHITKNADGSETEIVDIFGKSVPGTVAAAGTGLKLQERDIVERQPATDGSVRETLRAQRPTVGDATVLSSPVVISQTICKGKCHD
jgi:hypothetical protein